MNLGTRKEHTVREAINLPLKNYSSIYLLNKGNSTAIINDFELKPSENHSITTGNLLVTEDLDIDFNNTIGDENQLYLSVVSLKKCK